MRSFRESLSVPSTALALDVGGTKLEGGVVEADGTIVDRCRVATPEGVSAEATWAAVCEVLDPLIERHKCDLVGVGCGGPMEGRGELVSPLNIPAWRRFPLSSRLSERYRLPSALDNDAKALARAEGVWGAARDDDNYLAMVVSTGVGGGIVLDGRLLDGNGGNAGHIGHVNVEPQGAMCACGARGCLEAEVSGTAIARELGAPASEAPPEVRARAGRLTGRAIASVVCLLDLPLVLVAGSVALGFGDDFFVAAQAEIDASARLGFAVGARIAPCGLRGDGPLMGAAAVGFAARSGLPGDHR